MPPVDLTEDQSPLILGVMLTMLILGGLFITARVISRTVIKPGFGWDDSLIIITWVRLHASIVQFRCSIPAD